MQIQFSKEKIGKASALLRLLSSPPRLGVLCLLCKQELNVGQITRKINISQSALSQHLTKLRNAKIVKTRKVRQEVYYSIYDKTTLKILDALHSVYCK